jgi:hypothetical protein
MYSEFFQSRSPPKLAAKNGVLKDHENHLLSAFSASL